MSKIMFCFNLSIIWPLDDAVCSVARTGGCDDILCAGCPRCVDGRL